MHVEDLFVLLWASLGPGVANFEPSCTTCLIALCFQILLKRAESCLFKIYTDFTQHIWNKYNIFLYHLAHIFHKHYIPQANKKEQSASLLSYCFFSSHFPTTITKKSLIPSILDCSNSSSILQQGGITNKVQFLAFFFLPAKAQKLQKK